MKKSSKIILAVSGVVLGAAIYMGYQIYLISNGNESLTGKKETIPSPIKTLPAVTTGEADWRNWRGPDFEGKSKSTGIKTDWSAGLEKVWQINYLCQGESSASWSAPVIQGNRLIVSGRDESKDLVFCIDAENGGMIWTGSYEAEANDSHGPGPRATPFINAENVYTFGRSGDLVCWRLEDGKMLWQKNVKDVGGEEPTWGFSTTPLVLDNQVIVQGGGKALVIAYDKQTGDILWKSMEGKAGYAALVPVTIDSVKMVLAYHGTGLSCLNPRDGRELWTVPWKTDYEVNATTPVVSNDIVFHSSAYKMGCQAIKVSGKEFKVLWKNDALLAQHSDPVLIDGYLYGYSGESLRNSGDFKCIELQTGKTMWSTREIGQGTTTYVDGHLLCLDIKGNLALVKPDPSGFIKKGEVKAAIDDVKNPAWTVPVVANGKIYLRYLQQLVCYNITN